LAIIFSRRSVFCVINPETTITGGSAELVTIFWKKTTITALPVRFAL
jgi:hypothetical protein